MSAKMQTVREPGVALLPLLTHQDPQRIVVWHDTQPVRTDRFLAEVMALAAQLPSGKYAVNLCADRYRFLVSFCAVAVAGQTTLLPPSRTPQAVAEVMHAYPASYALGDGEPDAALAHYFRLPPTSMDEEMDAAGMPTIPADHVVAIGFTSGSTGTPKPNAKTWAGICASTALNAALLGADCAELNIVATVPAQHMYGLETSVLLPLRSRAAVHAGHPFFSADVAHALAQVPAPRILVTTPFHLRALLREPDFTLPSIATIVSATAPLDRELAAVAEHRFGAAVVELFGSTETCVIAHRRTARAELWQLYPGVELQPQPDGTLVDAAHFAAAVPLQDIVELSHSRQFILRGRNGDLLEIAGKRASLSDLNRRLLAIGGVEDGVIFQLDTDARGVRRLAALVVAPGLREAEIFAALREAIDPAFLPRPLLRVATLPRNAAGKLSRADLLKSLSA